jgi:hypothetical protein
MSPALANASPRLRHSRAASFSTIDIVATVGGDGDTRSVSTIGSSVCSRGPRSVFSVFAGGSCCEDASRRTHRTAAGRHRELLLGLSDPRLQRRRIFRNHHPPREAHEHTEDDDDVTHPRGTREPSADSRRMAWAPSIPKA